MKKNGKNPEKSLPLRRDDRTWRVLPSSKSTDDSSLTEVSESDIHWMFDSSSQAVESHTKCHQSGHSSS